jgi:hypothetical protein
MVSPSNTPYTSGSGRCAVKGDAGGVRLTKTSKAVQAEIAAARLFIISLSFVYLADPAHLGLKHSGDEVKALSVRIRRRVDKRRNLWYHGPVRKQ